MDKFTKIWLILVSLTIFAFLIGWFRVSSYLIIGILLISTFIKGELVIEYFMGLGEIKGKFRYIPTVWLATIISIIAAGYYL